MRIKFDLCRHPDPSSRLTPKEVLKALVKSVEELCAVPVEDVPADSQAHILGAPLEAGNDLYTDLQKMYCAN